MITHLLPTARALCVALLALAALPLASVPVRAQAVVALVDRHPVTSFDVEQRVRIAALTERRRIDRKAALRELIDDRAKITEARRIGYRVTDDGVETEFDRLAKSAGQSPSQFGESLRRAGINPESLRDKIRADIAWFTILRAKSRAGTAVTNDELEKALAEEKAKARKVFDYQLRSIIFVVPGGASGAVIARQQAAAGAARSKFTSCEDSFENLLGQRDVAVRGIVSRSSDGMNDELAKLLEKTPVGGMTAPYRSSQGIEVIAVCDRKERDSTAALRASVEEKLQRQRLESRSKDALEEIRKRVLVQYR